MTDVIPDPLQEFLAQDPTALVDPTILAEQDLVKQEEAVRSGHGVVPVAVGLGAAYLVYRAYMARRMKEVVVKKGGDVDHRFLLAAASLVWNSFIPRWVSMTAPYLVAGYLEGIKDAKAGDVPPDVLRTIARGYAEELGNHINLVSAEAVVSGFNAQVNRKVPPFLAAKRVTDAYGVPKRGMNALVNVWTSEEKARVSDRPLPSSKEERSKALTAAQNTLRARQVGDNEEWAARTQAKQIVWMYGVDKGTIPSNARRVWITADDERVCEVCGPLDGKAAPVGEQFKTSLGKFWTPPTHVNCLPGDTLVAAQGVTGASTRMYQGEVYSITTRGGKQLTATPNHPVLTQRGWVAVQLLNVGDQVVSTVGGDRTLAGDQDSQHAEPMIEQVAQAFRKAPGVISTEVPLSAPDFHGDGTDDEVAVIWTDSHLAGVVDAMLVEQICEPVFDSAGVANDVLAGQSSGDLLLVADLTSPSSLVSRRDLDGSLLRAHHGPLNSFGIGATSALHTLLGEYSGDGSAGSGEAFAQRLLGLPGEVALDEIIEIRTDPFSGHVFNLSTADGWFIGNGIVTHNCRCDVALDLSETGDIQDEITALLESETVAKAVGADPYDRDPRGRFARDEGRSAKPFKEREAAVDELLAQVNQALTGVPLTEQKLERPSLTRPSLSQARPSLSGPSLSLIPLTPDKSQKAGINIRRRLHGPELKAKLRASIGENLQSGLWELNRSVDPIKTGKGTWEPLDHDLVAIIPHWDHAYDTVGLSDDVYEANDQIEWYVSPYGDVGDADLRHMDSKPLYQALYEYWQDVTNELIDDYQTMSREKRTYFDRDGTGMAYIIDRDAYETVIEHAINGIKDPGAFESSVFLHGYGENNTDEIEVSTVALADYLDVYDDIEQRQPKLLVANHGLPGSTTFRSDGSKEVWTNPGRWVIKDSAKGQRAYAHYTYDMHYVVPEGLDEEG